MKLCASRLSSVLQTVPSQPPSRVNIPSSTPSSAGLGPRILNTFLPTIVSGTHIVSFIQSPHSSLPLHVQQPTCIPITSVDNWPIDRFLHTLHSPSRPYRFLAYSLALGNSISIITAHDSSPQYCRVLTFKARILGRFRSPLCTTRARSRLPASSRFYFPLHLLDLSSFAPSLMLPHCSEPFAYGDDH
jgi:hypothetical protein